MAAIDAAGTAPSLPPLLASAGADAANARARLAQYFCNEVLKAQPPAMMMNVQAATGRIRQLQDGRWQLDMTDGEHSVTATSDDRGTLCRCAEALKKPVKGSVMATTLMPPLQLKSLEVRIGDAERDKALRALREHFAQGRLTQAEMEERTGRAAEAARQSELDVLFTDLPEVTPSPALARQVTAPPAPLKPGGIGPREKVIACLASVIIGLIVFMIMNGVPH